MILSKLFMLLLLIQKHISFKIQFLNLEFQSGYITVLKLLVGFFRENKLLFILTHIGLTALFCMSVFLLYLLEVYCRGLTINEKDKYNNVLDKSIKQLRVIENRLDNKEALDYKKMSGMGDELLNVYRWILFWERRRDNNSFFYNLFRALVW